MNIFHVERMYFECVSTVGGRVKTVCMDDESSLDTKRVITKRFGTVAELVQLVTVAKDPCGGCSLLILPREREME